VLSISGHIQAKLSKGLRKNIAPGGATGDNPYLKAAELCSVIFKCQKGDPEPNFASVTTHINSLIVEDAVISA
jgi:hypothetical protein